MIRYLLRRLLLLPLSLFLLSLVCFGLRQITPGDPVKRLLPKAESRLVNEDPSSYDVAYRRAAINLGLDRPPFYFSVYNGALPDTLHRIVRPEERSMLRAFTLYCGNWEVVQEYYWELRRMSYTVATNEHTPTIRRLLLQDDITAARSVIEQLPEHPETAGLTDAFRALEEKSTQHRLLLPAFRWNGFDNQYQRWIGQLLRGDLGSSLIDKRPVGPKVWAAAKVTALINGLAIFLVFLLSIPIGLMAAGYQGGWFDRLSTFGLFLLFGIPSFWLAMLMANYLTTPAFGMDFFPSMGLGNIPDGTSWWTAFRIRSSHLFLPVVCIAYPSLAYVSRHLRQSALKQLDQAYIKTARLKGLSQRSILWGHVFQNASFPIITLLGGIFPALLAGSVLIERIFNLPGMGQLLYNAALERDWPVVITLVLLNGVLTAIGLMMADLGYALADPRVRFSSTKNSVP